MRSSEASRLREYVADAGDSLSQLFNAILGWNNTATLGSILAYVFYWLVIAATLVYLKWSEGRASFFGLKSRIGRERADRQRRERETVAETPGVEEKEEYDGVKT